MKKTSHNSNKSKNKPSSDAPAGRRRGGNPRQDAHAMAEALVLDWKKRQRKPSNYIVGPNALNYVTNSGQTAAGNLATLSGNNIFTASNTFAGIVALPAQTPSRLLGTGVSTNLTNFAVGSGLSLSAGTLSSTVTNFYPDTNQFIVDASTNLHIVSGVILTNVTVRSNLSAVYLGFISSGSAPSISVNSGGALGTPGNGATATLDGAATDARGIAVLTAASTGVLAATKAATLTFGKTKPAADEFVIINFLDSSAGPTSKAMWFYATNFTATSFDIWSGPNGPVASTGYRIAYLCIQ